MLNGIMKGSKFISANASESFSCKKNHISGIHSSRADKYTLAAQHASFKLVKDLVILPPFYKYVELPEAEFRKTA